ncbi:hypothetical protein BD626DRAFT_516956 [Schizophyllum amplum]|uniref:Uncharacterized protein n=1 Tax=Schizophyllum amplum TaxID=97359 RepID=A0A550BWN0_9AGAR|nr:hypothetical protein BD626DRAFT_516956 [Auriculariopsis ampla]
MRGSTYSLDGAGRSGDHAVPIKVSTPISLRSAIPRFSPACIVRSGVFGWCPPSWCM